MKVMVALEERFFETRDGHIYSNTITTYSFLRRYLSVFDEVIVLARVFQLAEEQPEKHRADGPNVRFYNLPYYVGPWQYLARRSQLKACIARGVSEADAFILRIPGTISGLLWQVLQKRRLPYGVEVVGDPWEALLSANVRTILSPVARYVITRNTKQQCMGASVAAYVTEEWLQRRYPCNCWSTHYSSIELPDDMITDEHTLKARLDSIERAIAEKRPLNICHMGSMDALYKAQDILIESIAICRSWGLNIRLTLLGDGRYSHYFVAKAKEHGVTKHVNFLGKLPSGKAVTDQLDLADLFVLPSITEGLPRALIEAMARGLPCLGSNVGGIPELLPIDCLFPPRDPQALAAKIESTIQDKRRLEQMAGRNVQKAREFRKEELDGRRKQLYQRIAEMSIAAK